MTNPLDQLNLRPQERRILVVVLFLVFVVLNVMFVRPLFGQFGEMQLELAKARRMQARYEEEIAKAPGYERMEKDFKSKGGEVLSEELQLQRIVDNQARGSDVAVSRYSPGVRSSTRTNQFFEDQGLTIDFVSNSTNLVEFMVGLASGNSMIHVQDMSLRPDGSGTKLAGNMLFVASYQKKQPTFAPTSGAPIKPGMAAAKPATPSAAPKTNAVLKPNPSVAPIKPSSGTNLPGLNRPKLGGPPTIKPGTNAVRSAATNAVKPKK